ncbi:WD40-repeat-containing domain protein [Cunninghamella echinulata]|nr:WD40-repeat-containing domain protein [Cunninghamella echinulata]
MTIPSIGYHQDLSSSSIPFSPTGNSPSYINSNNNSNSSTFSPQPTTRSYSSSSSLSSSPRKPKTNITKTNSSFVQKIITNGQLAKILVERTSEDTNLFYNCGSSFVWMDAACKPMEPLSRIIFNRAFPTSHDVNLLTRGSAHLDIIIGFTSGDIIWFDPLCNKYGRINKGGVMNSSSITMIRWLQGSENLFMAAFQDGSIMLFDKEKEDELFNPNDHDKNVTTTSNHTSSSTSPPSSFRITKPSAKISAKSNPVAHWKLSNQSITAFAFSPDCQHVAVVGLDGYMRVINFVNEKLLDVYESYYGGLLCVSWSPDGRYILAGGQDDLVTIWAFREQRIIARCQGHSSWVTSVAFDPWRCDERVYRFASVGEDAKLILWDFSVPALHLPKTVINTRHRGASVSSMTNGNVLQTVIDRPATLHPVVSKTEVAILQPTMVKTIHADPCVGVYFREDAIITTDKRGRVCVWKRPS